jgi:hypothetical protein
VAVGHEEDVVSDSATLARNFDTLGPEGKAIASMVLERLAQGRLEYQDDFERKANWATEELEENVDALIYACKRSLEQSRFTLIDRRVQKATSEALELFGSAKQLAKLREECSELVTEICHWEDERSNLDKIAEEIAGVRITSIQAEKIVGAERMRAAMQKQIGKLEKHLEKAVAKRSALPPGTVEVVHG